jgi:putative flippase GtrA
MALQRFVRYGVTGLFNTGLSYAVYALGLYIGLNYALANLLACLAGVLVGYHTHLRFVFADASAPRLWRYVLLWGALYLLNIGLIKVLLTLGFDAYVAGALALPAMVVLSYGLNRVLVFKRGDAAPEALP